VGGPSVIRTTSTLRPVPIGGRMTEAELQKSLRHAMHEHGWMVHAVWSSLHSPRGWPDLFAVKGNTILAWELKNDKLTPTPEQIKWLDWWTEFASAIYEPSPVPLASWRPRIHVALVRPADLEAAYRAITGLEEGDWPAPWPRGRPGDPKTDGQR
jgi:Holliday junction resolvase